MNIENNDLKIPLVIGVTGHRDIAEKHIEDLKKKIRMIFDSLIEKYEDTPLILLSPLADGADRIVADVAFEDKFQDKITVSVPLPFGEDVNIYKDTFGTSYSKENPAEVKHQLRLTKKESIKEFNILMTKVNNQKKSFVPKTIPMPYDGKKNYSLVGEYIAIHSQILIALQNPCSEEGSGGTAEIVSKKLSGNYDYITDAKESVSVPERGLVYRVLTPRIKDTGAQIIDDNDKYTLSKIFPKTPTYIKTIKWSTQKNSNPLHYSTYQSNIICSLLPYKVCPWDDSKEETSFLNKCLDFYTHLFTKPCIKNSENESKSMNPFRREHRYINCLNKIIEENYHATLEYNNELEIKTNSITTRAYNDLKAYMPQIAYNINHHSDVNLILKNQKLQENKLEIKRILLRSAFAYLSSMFQGKTELYEKFLITLIFISSFTFFVVSKFGIDAAIVNSIYLATVILFFIVYRVFAKYKNLYEDTRALSEGLRVQNTWKDLGIDESVAYSYPSSYKDELNWIRTSLRSFNIFYFPKGSKTVSKEDELKVRNNWISDPKDSKKGQVPFFHKNIKKYQYENYTYTTNINTSVIIFMAVGFILTVDNIVEFINDDDTIRLKIFAGVFLTLASVTKAKQNFDGYSKIIKEYELSLAHFLRAKELLKDDTNDKKKIYKSLGIEALQENTFWTILRREKKYKSPSL